MNKIRRIAERLYTKVIGLEWVVTLVRWKFKGKKINEHTAKDKNIVANKDINKKHKGGKHEGTY